MFCFRGGIVSMRGHAFDFLSRRWSCAEVQIMIPKLVPFHNRLMARCLAFGFPVSIHSLHESLPYVICLLIRLEIQSTRYFFSKRKPVISRIRST